MKGRARERRGWGGGSGPAGRGRGWERCRVGLVRGSGLTRRGLGWERCGVGLRGTGRRGWVGGIDVGKGGEVRVKELVGGRWWMSFFFEGKNVFIKCDVTGKMNFARLKIKAPIATIIGGVAKEHTTSRARVKLVFAFSRKVRIASTTKHTKGIIGWVF